MSECRIRFMIFSALLLLLSGVVGTALGETWHLEQGQDWKAVSAKGQAKYLMAVAQIKQLVNTGQSEAAGAAIEKLKEDFPEITGADLDAFFAAEMLFCEGRFVKAARAYDKFLAGYSGSKLHEAALDRQFGIATAF